MVVKHLSIGGVQTNSQLRNFEMDDDDGYLEIDDLGNPIGADIVESDNDVGTCLDIISA